MKSLCEIKDVLKCYLLDNQHIMLEIKTCGYDLKYDLSGHGYEPILHAKCNIQRYSFDIHGDLWFPHLPSEDEEHALQSFDEWYAFSERMAIEVASRVAWLHNLPDEYKVDFSLLKGNLEFCAEDMCYRKCLCFYGEDTSYVHFLMWNFNPLYWEPVLELDYPGFSKPNIKVVSSELFGKSYIMISCLTVEQKLAITTKDGQPIVVRRSNAK